MRTLRVLPKQIPQVWAYIKYATFKVEGLTEENKEPYFNELLYRLLSEKCQCVIDIDEDRTIRKVYVTRIDTDQLNDVRLLHVLIAYAFKPSSEKEWIESAEMIKKFARSMSCDKLMVTSAVQRVWNICEEMLGFKEKYRTFFLDL